MSKTDYVGIDYSNGLSNVDLKTGIHYGVIHHGEVGQAWYDESEGYYNYTCPGCEYDFGSEYPDIDEGCPECSYTFNDYDYDMLDPISHYFEDDEYSMEQGFDDCDIWILKSPFYTYAQYCSPCAPGAGYIMNYMAEGEGIKTYCLPGEWFENETAPYPVYRVKDDTRVNTLFKSEG